MDKKRVNFGAVIESFKTKSVRYGGYSAAGVMMTLVFLVIFNLIIQQIPLKIDLTSERLFSLSEQTLQVLSALEQDIYIYGIYDTGKESAVMTALLSRYKESSNHIKVTYIDPDKNPVFMRRFDNSGTVIHEGSLIVERENYVRIISPHELYDVSYTQSGQPQIIGFAAEQRLTAAILYVATGYDPKMYELIGHGETTLAELGFSAMIERENYESRYLNLLTEPKVPEDATVVVVISPLFDLTPLESKKLIDYLDSGGRAIFLFDFISFEPMPEFSSVMAHIGLEMINGVIMEFDSTLLMMADNPFYITPKLKSHEILNPLTDKRIQVIIPNSLAFAPAEVKRRELQLIPLMESSPKSWIRTVNNASLNMLPTDIQGPATLAYAVSSIFFDPVKKEGYRIVAVGSASFLRPISSSGTYKGNADFFMNALAWVNERSQMLTVRSKSLYTLPMNMNYRMILIYTGVIVLLIPGLILAFGLIVWMRRQVL